MADPVERPRCGECGRVLPRSYRAKTPGDVEAAVSADLIALGVKGSGRETFGALALVLARQLDAGGSPNQVARAAAELRAMMGVLVRGSEGVGDDEAAEIDGSRMSAPVVDAG